MKFRERREALGLSLEEVAEKVGMTVEEVKFFEIADEQEEENKDVS